MKYLLIAYIGSVMFAFAALSKDFSRTWDKKALKDILLILCPIVNTYIGARYFKENVDRLNK